MNNGTWAVCCRYRYLYLRIIWHRLVSACFVYALFTFDEQDRHWDIMNLKTMRKYSISANFYTRLIWSQHTWKHTKTLCIFSFKTKKETQMPYACALDISTFLTTSGGLSNRPCIFKLRMKVTDKKNHQLLVTCYKVCIKLMTFSNFLTFFVFGRVDGKIILI